MTGRPFISMDSRTEANLGEVKTMSLKHFGAGLNSNSITVSNLEGMEEDEARPASLTAKPGTVEGSVVSSWLSALAVFDAIFAAFCCLLRIVFHAAKESLRGSFSGGSSGGVGSLLPVSLSSSRSVPRRLRRRLRLCTFPGGNGGGVGGPGVFGFGGRGVFLRHLPLPLQSFPSLSGGVVWASRGRGGTWSASVMSGRNGPPARAHSRQ